MRPFVHQASSNRVVFGAGTFAALAEEVDRLGTARVFVLSTPPQSDLAEAAAEVLGPRHVGSYTGARMHTPINVTAEAMEALGASGADTILSVGGGSTIGLGKALSVRTGLPHVAIPTTYAGSEMTPILGETENGIKTTRVDAAILPCTTIYDVNLTVGLPVAMSVTSGLNAMAHAAEALYAHDRTPIIEIMAASSLSSFAKALPKLVQDPTDPSARWNALQGAWLAGVCLGTVSMGIHHKLCHTLAGSFDLPHAETHAVVLPYALAYVAPKAPEAMATLANAIGAENAPMGLHTLAKGLGAPTSLSEIGMPREGLDQAAKLAMTKQYPSPRALDLKSIRYLLELAFDGRDPIGI